MKSPKRLKKDRTYMYFSKGSYNFEPFEEIVLVRFKGRHKHFSQWSTEGFHLTGSNYYSKKRVDWFEKFLGTMTIDYWNESGFAMVEYLGSWKD